MRARDNAGRPGFVGQRREAQHVIVRGARDALARQVVGVETGQHGHAEQVGRGDAPARSFLLRGLARRPHHGDATGGVDGEIVRFQRDRAAHCARDGVRDVVQLEVEEEGSADGAHRAHALRPMCAEILEAELEAAHRRREQMREPFDRRPVARIESTIERDVRHEHPVQARIVYLRAGRGTTAEPESRGRG